MHSSRPRGSNCLRKAVQARGSVCANVAAQFQRHYLFVAPLAWFSDPRCQELIEHEVKTLIGQRVFGLGLGYEDLNDHDEALTGSAPP